MAKDVIYIDVEDDITTIIGKVKASHEGIVALVPPNRIGVLQSAVNMRLLAKSAKSAKKHVVLITNNQPLAMLAATADIPVAKNLQSKPELADTPVLKVDGDDVIDGEQLAVGELVGTAGTDETESGIDAVIEAQKEKPDDKPAKKAADKKKIPDFSSFRKKLFLFGGLGVLLIGFLVWAIWFAPRATVIITAKTTTATVDRNVELTLDGQTNVENGVLRAVRQEQKQDISVEFAATGERNVGDKATGRVRLSHQSLSSATVPAGTRLSTSGGLVFVLDTAVVLPASQIGGPGCFPTACPGTATGRVTASEGGANYNAATGSLSGAPSGVSASLVDATSGGTNRIARVVSEDDVEKAAAALGEKKADDLRAKLKSAFGASGVIIDDSYRETRGDPTPSVAVGAEASGSVNLKATITATMLAVEQSQLNNFLRASMEKEIAGKANQKIFDDGTKGVKFAQFSDRNDQLTVRVTANGKIGPEIKEDDVKEQVRGKRYGDIQASLEAIEGVNDVDTKFWPFWVRTVPDNTERITVEFKLENAD